MRSGFSLRQVSILPYCFHNFHNNSICHRQRMRTNASSALSFSAGTFVRRKIQSDTCKRLLLVFLVFFRLFFFFFSSFFPFLGPHAWTPLLEAGWYTVWLAFIRRCSLFKCTAYIWHGKRSESPAWIGVSITCSPAWLCR